MLSYNKIYKVDIVDYKKGMLCCSETSTCVNMCKKAVLPIEIIKYVEAGDKISCSVKGAKIVRDGRVIVFGDLFMKRPSLGRDWHISDNITDREQSRAKLRFERKNPMGKNKNSPFYLIGRLVNELIM